MHVFMLPSPLCTCFGDIRLIGMYFLVDSSHMDALFGRLNFYNVIFSETQFWWNYAPWSQKHKFLSNEKRNLYENLYFSSQDVYLLPCKFLWWSVNAQGRKNGKPGKVWVCTFLRKLEEKRKNQVLGKISQKWQVL